MLNYYICKRLLQLNKGQPVKKTWWVEGSKENHACTTAPSGAMVCFRYAHHVGPTCTACDFAHKMTPALKKSMLKVNVNYRTCFFGHCKTPTDFLSFILMPPVSLI